MYMYAGLHPESIHWAGKLQWLELLANLLVLDIEGKSWLLSNLRKSVVQSSI